MIARYEGLRNHGQISSSLWPSENRGVVGSIPTLAISLQGQMRRPPRRRFCAQVNSLQERGPASDRYSKPMDALIALVGGSAGAVLTLLFRVPGDIRNHNRLVREVDEDLAQWVSDDCVVLERELRGQMNTAGQHLDDGSYLTGVAHSKEQALHRYRDQERQALAKVGEWHDAEGFLHRCLRRLPGVKAFPTLSTPEVVEPILAGWREDVLTGPHSSVHPK